MPSPANTRHGTTATRADRDLGFARPGSDDPMVLACRRANIAAILELQHQRGRRRDRPPSEGAR
jgi:hypothetical protein